MAKKNLLILGAAAVQDDAVKAAQKLGYNVYVAAQAADGPAARSADKFIEENFMNLEAMRDLIVAENIDAVYSTGSDLAMPVASKLSERLELPHFVSAKTATACNDKVAMRLATQDLMGSVPAIKSGEEGCPEITFDGPWIVKPSDAQGQRGITKVEKSEELGTAIEFARSHSRSNNAIIERFVGGTEISVNAYMVAGKLVFLTVSDRETWPEYVGLIRAHIIPSQYVEDPRLMAEIQDVLEAFALRLGIENGPLYAQMKVENGRAYVIEITPRLDGCHMWRLIKQASGFDLMDATLRHLLTGEIPTDFGGPINEKWKLEFHCQAPNTQALYPEGYDVVDGKEFSYRYYEPGAVIRPVNGRFDKIGYRISCAKGE